MPNLNLKKYTKEFEQKWDDFIIKESINGTFVQTRKFLNYHQEDRFVDHSLIIFRGEDSIVGVIPACDLQDEGKRTFYSHKGSTFGGIIINRECNDAESINKICSMLDNYLREKGFERIVLKPTADIFCKSNTKIIDYFLFKEGFKDMCDLCSYIDLTQYNSNNIYDNFKHTTQKKCRKALAEGLIFKKIEGEENISLFHGILESNLERFGVTPIHTVEELIDLKENRFTENIDFYGVNYNGVLIASSMIFKYNSGVFHVQNGVMDYNYSTQLPMYFMYYNLIKIACESGFKFFSFGRSTEMDGNKLNYGLIRFKEGFGSIAGISTIYLKNLFNVFKNQNAL